MKSGINIPPSSDRANLCAVVRYRRYTGPGSTNVGYQLIARECSPKCTYVDLYVWLRCNVRDDQYEEN